MYKKILFIALMLSAIANAQLSLYVDSQDVTEVSASSSGSLGIGVYLDEGNTCFGHTVIVTISSGTLDAASITAPIVFPIPTSVIGEASGASVRFSGGTLFGDPQGGPGYLVNDIDYTFASLMGDVTVTLTAVGGGCTFNGTAITEDTVLDTLTIHHPSAADAVTLDLSVHSKSEGMGTVAYTGDLYKGEEITVTATPASGYRVKRWSGTDSKDPVKVQTVTLKRNKHKVSVQFEETPNQEVTKATFKAGKVRGGSDDSFIIQGVLGAGASIVPETDGTIDVEIKSDGGAVLFSQTLDYADMTVKWPKSLTYTDKEAANGELEMFKYDILKGKFQMKASDQDLAGWSAPLTLTVSIGNGNGYEAIILISGSGDADVINGKKYMPLQFMIGQESSLTVDKDKVKENKDGTVSGTVTGRFSTLYDPADYNLATAEILYGDFSQVLEVEKKGSKDVYTFKRAKDADPAVQFITAATFDFEKAEFKISFKDADFGVDETLGVTFGWDE